MYRGISLKMAANPIVSHLLKLTGLNVLRCSGYTTFKGLTKTACLTNANEEVYCSNFIQKYCSAANNIPIVSYEYIKQLTKRPEVVLIDVREPQELKETGQIPTSINIPVGQVADELGPTADKCAFKAKYGRNKPERNTELIFHCRIGKRSQHAAEVAKTLGYQNTKNYLGSWTEWAEKEGLPL